MKNKDSVSILCDRAQQRSARSCGAADSVVGRSRGSVLRAEEETGAAESPHLAPIFVSTQINVLAKFKLVPRLSCNEDMRVLVSPRPRTLATARPHTQPAAHHTAGPPHSQKKGQTVWQTVWSAHTILQTV